VANYLNISAPAVNKWENANSYPDITLLAPLARLLKIDVNTLLAFNQSLNKEQIDNLINEVIHLADNTSYQAAFDKGCELIKQYPTCDELIFWIAMALRIELSRANTEAKEDYKQKIIKWLEIVAESNKEEFASMAKLDLSSMYRAKKDYDKAQELLDKIPDTGVRKTFQQAALLKSRGQLDEAYYVCEDMLLNNVHETLRVLTVIISMLCEEKKYDDAEYYFECAKQHIQAFDLGAYQQHTLELMIAEIQEDKERVINCIINMINTSNTMNHASKSLLYQHKNVGKNSEESSEYLRNMVINFIKEDKRLDFVKEDLRIKMILDNQVGGKIE
jgi:putative transcriptional regulator